MRTSFAFAVICGLALGAVIVAFLAQGPAAAESNQNLVWCQGDDKASAEQQINGCTALIQSGSYRGQDLARTYFSRAMGYLRKQDVDRAIGDFDAGLALDPGNATALYNRAIGYDANANPEGAERSVAISGSL